VGTFALKLLGGASLTGPSGPLSGRVVQRRQVALLALLGGSRSSPLTRDKAVAILWPESTAANARASLSDTLHILHKALGDEAIVLSSDDLRLNPEVVWCDVQAFRAALREGRPGEALDMYEGPFLDGFHFTAALELDRWLDGERDALRREARGAADALAAEREATGDLAGAVWAARRALALEPHDETAVRMLMRLLAAAGDRGAAVETYEAFARALQADLELEPSPETLEMAQWIREGRIPSTISGSARLEAIGPADARGDDGGGEEPGHHLRQGPASPPEPEEAAKTARFRLRILGGLALDGPAGAATPLPLQRRAGAVLAVLAVCGDLGCTLDRLSALLWPEEDAPRSRHRLRDTLRTIRRALGPEALLSVGEIVRMDPAAVSSDVQEFTEALAAGRLAEAVSAYRGPLLDGVRLEEAPGFERWVDEERARLSRECQEALKRLAKRAELEGRWDGAADWWARALALDPLNTRFVVRRMVALARGGDRANAIREGEAHRRRLKSEMGLEPDAAFLEELERIYRAEVGTAAFFTPLPLRVAPKEGTPPEPEG
jgi:DNA-binding SARP family transcriptional activator